MKPFSFIYPVTKKQTAVGRIGSQVYDHVADLIVNGIAKITHANVLNNISPKYDVQINEVLFEGNDIFHEIEIFESIENIKAACLNHMRELFKADEVQPGNDSVKMFPALARVVTMPLRRRAK